MIAGVAATALPVTAALGQGTRVRLPLQDFLADQRLSNALRKGVAAMKTRKPSDPLSWFFQAAVHGVTDYLWGEAAKIDPDVLNVDRAKYWNQCPHFRQNSANFLPWHRAYTYHFEEILRMHTEEDDFALPYWDYSLPSQMDFPKFFGIKHLNGDTNDDTPTNINPLFHPDRDYFLCGYEHPYTDQLPLSQLSPRAVDSSRALASPVFFGSTESTGLGGGIADTSTATRGLLEQSPHDQIHRVVGGSVQGIDDNDHPISAVGAMATPPTAGFDPIFPIHHANIDRLWMIWSCMSGKSWGTLPPGTWFDEKPWYFFDTAGREVNRPRKDYFDHRALGVRFKDEDPNCTPLQLPPMAFVPASVQLSAKTRVLQSHGLRVDAPIRAPATGPTRLPVVPPAMMSSPGLKSFNSMLGVANEALRATILLHDVDTAATGATGFDAFLVPVGTPAGSLSRQGPAYLGPISLFNHSNDGKMVIDQIFDASQAMAAAKQKSLEGLELVLVPYALRTAPKMATPLKLRAPLLEAAGYSLNWGAVPTDEHPHH
jgi:hypothetical protein